MKVLIVRVMEDWIETILSGDGNLKIVTFQGIPKFNLFFVWNISLLFSYLLVIFLQV
jgi:hypothetical protein